MQSGPPVSVFICSAQLTTFPQCSFSLEFPEILSQNHWLIVSGISEIMHCGILVDMPSSIISWTSYYRLIVHIEIWVLVLFQGQPRYINISSNIHLCSWMTNNFRITYAQTAVTSCYVTLSWSIYSSSCITIVKKDS